MPSETEATSATCATLDDATAPTRIVLPPRKLSQRELLENEHAAKTQLREAAAVNRRRASNYLSAAAAKSVSPICMGDHKHQMPIRGQLDNSGFEGGPAPVTTLASLRSWLDAGNKVALAAPLMPVLRGPQLMLSQHQAVSETDHPGSEYTGMRGMVARHPGG